MFTSCKWARVLSRQFQLPNTLIKCYYFSANGNDFVKKMRSLENLKASETFSPLLYEAGKYILFLGSELVCLRGNDKLIFLDYKGVQEIQKNKNPKTVFLDILSDSDPSVCLFAVDLVTASEFDLKQIETNFGGIFTEVRSSLYFLNQKEAQYVIHSRGLINFGQTNNFCSFCGGSLKEREGGYQKKCANCHRTIYPNVVPIGLTLIEDSTHEEVLLVRQARHPPGTYTCVAGFIEPGESMEENIKREVAEEVGLEVTNIEYITSQHWAMPSSQLTFGCIATALNKKTEMDKKELLDAKWFKAEDLMNAVKRVREIKDLKEMNATKLWAPQRNAVSHYVMVTWLKRYHNFEPSPEIVQ